MIAPLLPIQNQGAYNRLSLAQVTELMMTHPASPPRAMVVVDSDKPRDSNIFIRGDATDEEAIRFLADKGISGVVVIGDAGRPLGVLTATDVLIHHRAKLPAHA